MKRRIITALTIVGLLVIGLLVLLLSHPEHRAAKTNGAGDEQRAATLVPTNPPEIASSREPDGNTTRLDARPGDARVRMEGTSTIHDWQVESTVIGGYLAAGADFPIEPGQDVKPGKVEARVDAFIPVRSLRSIEKDGSPYSDKMNEVMYDHLKQPTSPKIYYRLSELVLKETPKSKDLPYIFDAKGELVVAGVTNTISMPVNVTPLGNKTVKITGNTTAKMTSFKMDPPAPLIFALKTGDEVKLLFEWTVFQKPAAAAANKQ